MVSTEEIYHIDLTEPHGSRNAVVLPLPVISTASAVYNPDEDKVYYEEQETNTINRASLDGSNVEMLMWFPSEYSLLDLQYFLSISIFSTTFGWDN